MKISSLTHCNRRWLIQRRIWPRWFLPVVWSDILIAGQLEGHSHAVDVTDEGNWGDAVIGSYDALSVFDLYRLSEAARQSGVYSDSILEKVTRHFGHHWSSDFPALLTGLKRCPVLEWAETKRLSLGDLRPLSLMSDDAVSCLKRAVYSFAPSHSDGVQLIEWIADLDLMNRLGELAESDWKSLKTLQMKLKLLRFPETTGRDDGLREVVTRTIWPKQTSVRAYRSGDKSNLELKVTGADFEDLTRRLNAVKELTEHL